jgi:hypothetical protein
MRILIATLSLLAAAPAAAQEWNRFGSERFGFALDIPPDYSISFESENGDGRVYHGAGGDHLLAIWGADLDAGFLPEVRARMSQDKSDGWDISYERLTPEWASYSGTKNDTIRYVRAVRLCDDRAAFFYLEYPREEKEALDPVVVRLVRSMRRTDPCG